MKLFITGANGMVGRNLLADPRAQGHQIDAPSSADLDLRDEEAVKDRIGAFDPDCVIHMAAVVGGIQANINEPFRFLVDNLRMATSVIAGSRDLGVPRLLNVGSSCMYPRDMDRPLAPELILSAPLEPTNEGYALAKIVSSKIAEFVGRERPELIYRTLVPCNLYGPYDNFDPIRSHMIPAIIRKLVEAKREGQDSVEIWGTGEARREFMFAGDLADFIWTFLDEMERLPVVTNVGVGDDHTVNEYYQTAADVVGFTGTFSHDLTRPTGMNRKLLDVSQQIQLGWAPSTSLRDGLDATVCFFEQHYQ